MVDNINTSQRADKTSSVSFLKSLKVFRLKAAILGLRFVKSMMFNCGNPREPKGTSHGDPWSLLFTNDVNEKKWENSPKIGVNEFFPKKPKGT